MKRIPVALALLCLAAGLAFSASAVPAARAQDAAGPAGERIESFSARAIVQTDGALDVTETIAYNFGIEDRHGIYRDIPLKYNAGKGSISISGIAVTDELGQEQPFAIQRSGGYQRIKIGDPDVLVTGIKTYVIGYRVEGAAQWGQDADLVAWNVTGDGWQVPMQRAGVSLVLPLAPTSTGIACYEGAYGSTEPCAASGASLSATRPLEPGEGLTFSLSFPKGVLTPPPPSAQFLKLLFLYWPALLPVAAFALLFRRWWRHGRDPSGRGTIIPEYEPPAGLSPIEAGTLLSGRVKPAYISAQIISLAVRGFLKITPSEGGFLKSKDYTFDKLKDAGAEESAADRRLLLGLFNTGPQLKSFTDLKKIAKAAKGQSDDDALAALEAMGDPRASVALFDLKQKFSSTAEGVKGSVYDSLVAKGLYDKDPRKVIAGYLFAGFALFFGGFWMFGPWPALAASCIATGLLVVVFGLIMPRVTKEGALAKEAIKGFKDYLNIAEKDRINFHNPPTKTPELFERFLPYALALGVVDAWAKEFEGIYIQPPSWYGGAWHGTFAATAFAHDLGGFNAASGQAFAAGSSGGSGGGFSGGGAGGGGGGSW